MHVYLFICLTGWWMNMTFGRLVRSFDHPGGNIYRSNGGELYGPGVILSNGELWADPIFVYGKDYGLRMDEQHERVDGALNFFMWWIVELLSSEESLNGLRPTVGLFNALWIAIGLMDDFDYG